jgi:hypothetical protein
MSDNAKNGKPCRRADFSVFGGMWAFGQFTQVARAGTGPTSIKKVAMTIPSLHRRQLLLGAAATTASFLLPWQIENAHAGTVPNLSHWLSQNASVRLMIQWEDSNGKVTAFPQWTAGMQSTLFSAFNSAYLGASNNLPLIASNIAAPSLVGNPWNYPTVISSYDAWNLYISYVANSLAVELRGDVPWSILAMSNESLQILFDSRQFFIWNSIVGGYDCCATTNLNCCVPAPAAYVYQEFLNSNGIPNPTHITRPQTLANGNSAMTDAFARLLSWCGDKLCHYFGVGDLENMQATWQYPGVPPVASIISGTFNTNPSSNFPTKMHWTYGCHGTSSFLQSVSRAMNIAVAPQVVPNSGHGCAYVPELDVWLSHGDDPYDRTIQFSPELVGPALSFPRKNLLITRDQYGALYGNLALSDGNVGFHTASLAVQYLPLGLLHWYIYDISSNATHANGQVLALLSPFFNLAQLEGMNLWQNMDAKIASLGGANAVDQVYWQALASSQA